MNHWIHALKVWNAKKGGKYVVPKKGTAEYNEVKKIQEKMENEDTSSSDSSSE